MTERKQFFAIRTIAGGMHVSWVADDGLEVETWSGDNRNITMVGIGTGTGPGVEMVFTQRGDDGGRTTRCTASPWGNKWPDDEAVIDWIITEVENHIEGARAAIIQFG